MKKKDTKELSKIKINPKCCAFCSSRCSTCGSVDISVSYDRIYEFKKNKIKFLESIAEIACNKCNVEHNDISEDFKKQFGSSVIIETIKETVPSEDLANQLDKHFELNEGYNLPKKIINDISEKDICNYIQAYEYENDDRNTISLNSKESFCVDSSGNKVDTEVTSFLNKLNFISYVQIECKDDSNHPGKHYVIETKKIKCVIE